MANRTVTILSRLKKLLSTDPSDSDLNMVFPVIVPRSYFARGNWPGPHSLLRHPSLGLVWAILSESDAMLYVNFEQAESWERSGIDWRRQALKNLSESCSDQIWSHEKRTEDGELEYAVLMHDDGLGSSRLLLLDAVKTDAPSPTCVGLPDRSCAILFFEPADHSVATSPSELVEKMYKDATTPMLGQLLEPGDFSLQDSAA